MGTAVLTRTRPAAARSPVALWHLLSLDAPCVAAGWVAFLCHELRIAEPLSVPVALGLAVWLLYAADRMQDAARGEITEERHRFHLAHRNAFLCAGLIAAVLLAVLMAHLPHALRRGWLLLAAPLCLYVFAVHVARVHRLSKEPLVATMFAAAVAMPLAVHYRSLGGAGLPVLVAFGCLCWLNCTAIARWEQSLDSTDAGTAWMGRHFEAAVGLTACTALPLILFPHTRAIAVALMCAAMCLQIVDTCRNYVPRTTLRALADAALLTPIIVWPLQALLKSR